MEVVHLAGAYNALLFSHLSTFLYVPFMLLLLFRDVLWWRIIVVINFYSNTTNNSHILFRWIRFFPWWQNRKVTLFVAPVYPFICLRVMDQLNGGPLAIRHFYITKRILLGTLLHHISVNLWGEEININKVYTEEIIHWYLHPLPPQAPIAFSNQNQTLKIVLLWEIRISLAYVPAGVDVTWYAPFRVAKFRSKLCHLSCHFTCPLVHKYT